MDAYDVDFTDPVRKTGMVYAERTKLEELADNFKEHKHVVSLFGRVWAGRSGAELGPWPQNDKVQDQLRADFRPDRDGDPERGLSLGSKRASWDNTTDEHGDAEAVPPAKRRSTRSSRR